MSYYDRDNPYRKHGAFVESGSDRIVKWVSPRECHYKGHVAQIAPDGDNMKWIVYKAGTYETIEEGVIQFRDQAPSVMLEGADPRLARAMGSARYDSKDKQLANLVLAQIKIGEWFKAHENWWVENTETNTEEEVEYQQVRVLNRRK